MRRKEDNGADWAGRYFLHTATLPKCAASPDKGPHNERVPAPKNRPSNPLPWRNLVRIMPSPKRWKSSQTRRCPAGPDGVESSRDVNAIARSLNRRPQQTLGWMSPSQAFAQTVAFTPRGRRRYVAGLGWTRQPVKAGSRRAHAFGVRVRHQRSVRMPGQLQMVCMVRRRILRMRLVIVPPSTALFVGDFLHRSS